jgi:hypothetical protein
MIDLAQRSEAYEVALPYSLSVTVKPLTAAGMAAAPAAARRAVEAIERQAREPMEAGLALDGLPDLSAEGERDGSYQAQLIRELAVRHITSWTGVKLEEGPAPPTPENVAADDGALPGRRTVLPAVHAPPGAAERGKSGSRPSAAGTSSQVERPNERVVAGLEAEREALTQTERERFIAQALSRLSAEATAQQRRGTEQLAGALFDEQQAGQARQRLMDDDRPVIDRTRTATEQHAAQTLKLNELLAAGATDLTTYAVAALVAEGNVGGRKAVVVYRQRELAIQLLGEADPLAPSTTGRPRSSRER